MSSSPYLYKVYGIPVRSDIKFWEFTDISGVDAATEGRWAEIIFGKIPDRLDRGWIRVNANECLFQVPGKGRILVSRNGEKIVFDLDEPAFEEDLKPYLIICGFTALAHVRGLIPLHVSALRAPQGVFLFSGASGAGKSTIAAMLNARYGWKILCDDLAVLDPTNARDGTTSPLLHFGMNKIKLWEDAAQTLGISTHGAQRDYFRPHKVHLPVTASDPIPFSDVRAIVSLRWGAAQAISRKSSAHAFATLMNSVYPTLLVGPVSELKQIRTTLLALSGGLEALEFQRSKDADGQSVLPELLANLPS